MELQIREMMETDWNEVRKIYQYGIDTNLATFETHCPTYADWDKAHLKECRYVAVQGDIVVGWVVLSAVSQRRVFEGVAEISVYIDGNHKNIGGGTKLLNHVVCESEKKRFWLLESVIFDNNEASLGLHKKCGFREVGYREKMGKDQYGKWRNVVVLEKRSLLDEYN
nr:GNAT family N-acetyltransferase [uncultured Caproiciproducens sp.]